MSKQKRAIVLLSGGLDSATTLAIAKNDGFECFAMSFVYGQRHNVELEAARRVAKALGAIEHRVIQIDLGQFGGSALTDPGLEVPKDRTEIGEGVPITYVPARNLIFLSYAVAWGEVLGTFDIFIGVNVSDYSGYPDCRGEFISAFEKMANMATAATTEGGKEYTIHTPIIGMTKGQIILRASELGVDYSLTHSCYDPDDKGRACGRCDSCLLRLKGFKEAGFKDPVFYQQ